MAAGTTLTAVTSWEIRFTEFVPEPFLMAMDTGYGHWKTVYHRHRRWSGDGTWRMVLSELRVDCDLQEAGEWAVAVDGTVI